VFDENLKELKRVKLFNEVGRLYCMDSNNNSEMVAL
jgi:hypothetical protein